MLKKSKKSMKNTPFGLWIVHCALLLIPSAPPIQGPSGSILTHRFQNNSTSDVEVELSIGQVHRRTASEIQLKKREERYKQPYLWIYFHWRSVISLDALPTKWQRGIADSLNLIHHHLDDRTSAGISYVYLMRSRGLAWNGHTASYTYVEKINAIICLRFC